MGVQLRQSAWLILGLASAMASADPDVEKYREILLNAVLEVPPEKRTFQVPVVQPPQRRFERMASGINGQPGPEISRTSDPNIQMVPQTFEFQGPRQKVLGEMTRALEIAKGNPSVKFEDKIKEISIELVPTDSRETFMGFAKNPEITALLGKPSEEAAPASHPPASSTPNANEDKYKKFEEAQKTLTSQFEKADSDLLENIEQRRNQALTDFARQQRQANNQQANEDAQRRNAEEAARQAAADQAAKNAGGAGGGAGSGSGAGGGAGGKGKGVEAVKIDAPNLGGQDFSSMISGLKGGGSEIDPKLLGPSRGISSLDNGGGITPVSMSNQPVLPKPSAKTFADNKSESLKFNSNLPPLTGGKAGTAIQNGGSIPPSNAQSDNGGAPGSGMVGAGNPGGGAGLTSGDPYPSNGIEKGAKAASYNLVKDGKYGEANGGGGSGDDDGDGSVDGGGDAGATATRNLFKEVLTPVAVTKNGPKGVFGYMGLIRTICASPRGKIVGVCINAKSTASATQLQGATTVRGALAAN